MIDKTPTPSHTTSNSEQEDNAAMNDVRKQQPDSRHVAILRILGDQPDGSCRLSWLPSDMDFQAYRECRDAGWIDQAEGRGGFEVAQITDVGRHALSEPRP